MSLELLNGYLDKFLGDRNVPGEHSIEAEHEEDAAHVLHLCMNGIDVELAYFPEMDMFGIFADVMPIPQAAGIDFYRHLMQLNFHDSRDGAFGIDEGSNSIKYISVRTVEDLDYVEFESVFDNFIGTHEQLAPGLRERYLEGAATFDPTCVTPSSGQQTSDIGVEHTGDLAALPEDWDGSHLTEGTQVTGIAGAATEEFTAVEQPEVAEEDGALSIDPSEKEDEEDDLLFGGEAEDDEEVE